MTKESKEKLIKTILEQETLRPLSRRQRFLKAPLRTIPYYILAAASHIKPFLKTFPTLWGTKMTSYLPEGNTFYFYGYCEANLTNFLLRFLTPDMTFIDVGAHVGMYSMLAGEIIETGQIHSFEPTPRTFALLEKNTKHLKNITLYNKALSSQDETLTFQDYGAGYGAYNTASQEGAPALHHAPSEYQVAATSLSKICQEKSLEPDLIKLDAEGHEWKILEGATTLLQATPRPLFTIEVAGGTEWAEHRQRTFAILSEARYLPYTIKESGLVSPHEFKDDYTYDNLLFVPEEKVELVKFLITHD